MSSMFLGSWPCSLRLRAPSHISKIRCIKFRKTALPLTEENAGTVHTQGPINDSFSPRKHVKSFLGTYDPTLPPHIHALHPTCFHRVALACELPLLQSHCCVLRSRNLQFHVSSCAHVSLAIAQCSDVVASL